MAGFGEVASHKTYHPGADKFLTAEEYRAYSKKLDELYPQELKQFFKEWEAKKEKEYEDREKANDPEVLKQKEEERKKRLAENLKVAIVKSAEVRKARAEEKRKAKEEAKAIKLSSMSTEEREIYDKKVQRGKELASELLKKKEDHLVLGVENGR